MKSRLILLMLLAAAGPSYTASVTVEYVDGSVEIISGTRSYIARIGDSVPEEAVVRVGRNSIAELSKGDVVLKLTESGSYVVGDLVKYAAELSGLGFEDYLVRKLTRLFKKDEAADTTTAMGVRADENEQGEITWMGWDEGADLLDQAEEFLVDRQYDEALTLLYEALDYVDIDSEGRCLFYIGSCLYLQGDTLTALAYLAQAIPDPDEDFYSNMVVLKGKLLVESFSFRKALKWLEIHRIEETDLDSVQIVELLQGFSFRGLGDYDSAAIHLMKAHSANPDSETGRLAAEIRDSLY